MTSRLHAIFQALTVIGQGLNVASGMVPLKYQPIAAFALSVVSSALGLYNHYFRPDGSKIVQ